MDKVEEARLRIKNATLLKDDLTSKISRLKGALEEKENNLESMRQSCLKAGIDPDNIDSYIDGIMSQFETTMSQYEKSLFDLESKVKPLTAIMSGK